MQLTSLPVKDAQRQTVITLFLPVVPLNKIVRKGVYPSEIIKNMFVRVLYEFCFIKNNFIFLNIKERDEKGKKADVTKNTVFPLPFPWG